MMIRWTGLAPWEFEFPFPGSLTSTFLVGQGIASSGRSGTLVRVKRENLERVESSYTSIVGDI